MDIRKIIDKEINSYITLNRLKCNFSLIIVGSVKRGDYELDQSGNLFSDIDILVVIERKKDIEYIKDHFKYMYRYFLGEYGYQLGFIYSIKSVILRRKSAMFLQEITNKDFIIDGLGIRNFFSEEEYSLETKISEYFQSLFYYEAKYNFENSMRTSLKINTLVDCIYDLTEFGKSLYKLENTKYVIDNTKLNQFGISDDMQKKYTYILKKATNLHLSSMYFLNHTFLEPEILYCNVRDIVFLENEGICYYDAVQL